MGFHPAPGAIASEGALLTLDIEPLALVAHFLLIWSPCWFHGAPLALDLGPQPSPGAPWPMVSIVIPLALCLGAPLALEAPKALNLERLLVPCSIVS